MNPEKTTGVDMKAEERKSEALDKVASGIADLDDILLICEEEEKTK